MDMATTTDRKDEAMNIYETKQLHDLYKLANKRLDAQHYYCMTEYQNLLNFIDRIKAELERRGEVIA